MSWSGRKALPEVLVRLGGHLGYPIVVGRLFRRTRSGREALPDVQERSASPP